MNKLAQTLWEKFAHPDRHGYKDWMAPDKFEEAIEEALVGRWYDYPQSRPAEEPEFVWVLLSNKHVSLGRYHIRRDRFIDISGHDFKHGTVTAFSPIHKPELPT